MDGCRARLARRRACTAAQATVTAYLSRSSRNRRYTVAAANTISRIDSITSSGSSR